MESIRCLVFDDDADNMQLAEIQFALEEEWSEFVWSNGRALPRLQLTLVSSKAELLKTLRPANLQEKFDFFLCDIYVGNPPTGAVQPHDRLPQPEGFSFIKTAKKHGLPLCIALTSGHWGSYESYQKASREFADFVDGEYLKAELKGVSSKAAPQKMIGEIAQKLRGLGLIRNLEDHLQFETQIQESRTLGIVEDVGQANLVAFADQVSFPGATGVAVSSLSPGLSGAKVLKLTYSGPKEDFKTRPILLKVSRDRASLERELVNFRDLLRTPGRRLARTVAQPRNPDSGPLESNGWFAVSFECAAPATSLVDWLTASPPPTDLEVTRLIEGLIIGGHLSDTYKTTSQDDVVILEGVASSLLSHYRTMAILEAIDEFQPLLFKHEKGKLSQLDFLKTYLKEGRLEGVASVDLSKKPTRTCLVHGDLHGRNVLVTRNASQDSAVLIDIASMRRAVWTVDIVRLLCDVFLSGWDRGAPSLEWSGLKSWRDQLGLFARLGSAMPAPPKEPANRAVRTAVDWLYTKKFEIAGLPDEPYHASEFYLSLAVEFARASYRDRDLPAPKRAFALVVANALLRDASTSFQRR